MYKIKVLISNDVVSNGKIYEVEDERQEELLIQSLEHELDKEGFYIDDVIYLDNKGNELYNSEEKKLYKDLAEGFIDFMYNHKELDTTFEGSEGDFMSYYLDEYIEKYEKKNKVKLDEKRLRNEILEKLGQNPD